MPRLYGAPAYARPVVAVAQADRPFDPDELPLVVAMTDEERERIEQGIASEQPATQPTATPGLTSRPFSLRALSDRLRGLRG
ncbi:MAG: hypothetical protein V4515_05920 [Chloroflexota bacterium]